MRRGRYAQADSLYRRALAIQREALEAPHPRIASVFVARGELERQRGRLQESEAHLRRGLNMYTAAFPEGHRSVAEAKSALGAVLIERGDYAAAQPLLHEAVAALQERNGPADQAVRKAFRRLVQLYSARGQVEQAAAWRDSLATVQDAPAPATERLR